MTWVNGANYVPADPLRHWNMDVIGTLVDGPVAGTAAFRSVAPSGPYGISFWQTESSHGNLVEAAAYKGDWTWEGFVYLVGTATHILFSAGGWEGMPIEEANVTALIYVNSSNRLSVHWEYGASIPQSPSATSNTNIPTGQWVHLGVVKDSVAKTIAYYLNGAASGTATYVNNPTGGDSATHGVCRTAIGGYVNFGHTSNCRTSASTFSTTKRDATWMAASYAHLSTDGILPTDEHTWINANAILLSEIEDRGVHGPTMGSLPDGPPTPPAITVVSPVPGVAPGQPGGFAADWTVARLTPIVVDIDGDELAYACVVARYPANEVDDAIERVVYRRGVFRAEFASASNAEQVTPTKLRLSILPNEGWPSFESVAAIEFDVDAIAGGGLSDEAASS